jgi:hypothetical protein
MKLTPERKLVQRLAYCIELKCDKSVDPNRRFRLVRGYDDDIKKMYEKSTESYELLKGWPSKLVCLFSNGAI